jgi:hypothetical protein
MPITLLAIAALAVGAVLVAQRFAAPTKEKVEQGQKVLTHAYRPQLQGCRALEDAEIPEALPRPGVDEDLLYVGVEILYPNVERAPPGSYRLVRINGGEGTLDPIDTISEVADEGVFLMLVFRTNNGFLSGRLMRDDEALFENVEIE